ncbi:MAG: hypothetical protein LBT09_16285 [Planctomycetaceae bacterium]|jgi:predicted transcriptional regulator|nr:hypothetical protein [Planctomycetaceae bacterium]
MTLDIQLKQSVVDLLVAGTPARKVAEQLQVSENTVRYIAEQSGLSLRLLRVKTPKPVPVRPVTRRKPQTVQRMVEFAVLSRANLGCKVISNFYKCTVENVRHWLCVYNELFPESVVQTSRHKWQRQVMLEFGKRVYGWKKQHLAPQMIAQQTGKATNYVRACVSLYCKSIGERVPSAFKLKDNDVIFRRRAMLFAVIERRKQGATLKEVAAEFGLTTALVSRICIEIGRIKTNQRGIPKGKFVPVRSFTKGRRLMVLPEFEQDTESNIEIVQDVVDIETVLADAKQRIVKETAIAINRFERIKKSETRG